MRRRRARGWILAKHGARFAVSCVFLSHVKNTCTRFRVEIAQWRSCDNLKNRSRTGEGGRWALWFFGCAGVSSKPRPLGEGGYRVACGKFESRCNSRAGQAPPLQGDGNGGGIQCYSKSPSAAGS